MMLSDKIKGISNDFQLMDKKTLFVFFLILFSLRYFDATILSSGVFKNLSFGFMAFSIIISLPYFFKYKGGFVLPVQLIAAATLISIFMAWYTWGQGLQYSATTIPYMIWFAFFYLLKSEISINTIEKIILFFGVVYILLFTFQFTHNGVVYFGQAEEFVQDRGVVRINFPGGGVFFLTCFIAVNKVTSDVKYKYLWLTLALIGLVVIVLQVTRQSIFVMVLVYLFHFIRNVKLPYKIAIISIFAIATYIFLNAETSISKGLAEQQKVDASYGSDYIRILETEYFLTQFTPNTISKIFGNGFYNDTSNYGKTLISLVNNYGYYLSDIGLVEVYITFGILAILGFALMLVKSIIIPLPAQYQYLKYYIWMILITSLTSDSLIHYYYLVTTVIVLYCYQKLYIDKKILDQINFGQHYAQTRKNLNLVSNKEKNLVGDIKI